MPAANDITVKLKQEGVCTPYNPLPDQLFNLNLQWGKGTTQVFLSRHYPSSVTLQGMTIEEIEYLTFRLLETIQEVRSETTEHTPLIPSQEAGPEADAYKL